ncbi:MAG: hypothetical protein K1X47_07250 [Cyclobacteriaceae bacterium]|nr:hypothetical protein [Cyclobacteriaceae bacterium]
MKTIKSALLGTRQIDDSAAETLLPALNEILQQHRQLIIQRLIGDLPTYLDYKFQVRLKGRSLLDIKEKLIELRNSSVELSHYPHVVAQVQGRSLVHLTNEPFYVEIDEYIGGILKDLQPRQVA